MSKYGEGKTKHISIRLSEKEINKLKENADKEDMSVSDYIRKIIKKDL